ncbi:MAG TPA: shikimate dehydrogenase [Burkholderiaceae bacterium]|nr:shikimate dehydrogenase [Burkholderiaceae bacterium]
MTDRYAVIGNPIAHSRSPFIHERFAAQTGQDLVYERLLAPLDRFEATVQAFVQAAPAHTLSFDARGSSAENTDGIGLVRDLVERHAVVLKGSRAVILGAGGAASGVVLPLLEAGVRDVLIVNRTAARARALAERLGHSGASQAAIAGAGFEALDASRAAGAILINATSAGLSDARLPLSDAVFAAVAFAYDMVYGPRPTAYLVQAAAAGCPRQADGLGMLVEQAAESFRLWRGVAPQTEPVYRELRTAIGNA